MTTTNRVKAIEILLLYMSGQTKEAFAMLPSLPLEDLAHLGDMLDSHRAWLAS